MNGATSAMYHELGSGALGYDRTMRLARETRSCGQRSDCGKCEIGL
jgi:hypothetical protein